MSFKCACAFKCRLLIISILLKHLNVNKGILHAFKMHLFHIYSAIIVHLFRM